VKEFVETHNIIDSVTVLRGNLECSTRKGFA